MASYNELSINQKINVKATLQAWARFSVQHFQEQLDKKVYGLRTSKKGIQRSALGAGYKFGRGRSRTNSLRRTWWQNVQDGAGIDKVMIKFLLYGRFLDMGVGKGTSHSNRIAGRRLGHGKSSRRRIAWYSKTKSYEIKRLNEILAQQNVQLSFQSVENVLSKLSLTRTV